MSVVVLKVFSAVLIAVGIYAKVAKESDVVDTPMADPALSHVHHYVFFFACFGALLCVNDRPMHAMAEVKDYTVDLPIIFLYPSPSPTVFNSMCGYETQKMKSVVSRLFYTTGCLDEIVWWGTQNLLLVGGMTFALLCIEICMMSLASVQLCQIRSVQQKKRKRNPLLQQKND
uniref:Zgc:113223 n=1 Tax=Sinocyclocheilus rhinocerous TaxID=307959 RepID=A0A673L8K6_9TELE